MEDRRDPSIELDSEYSCSSKVGCGSMHVMCQYPSPGPSENCRGYVEIPITEDDILMVIHYFNFRRNLVAGGKEYKLPSASDMMMVEWDERLAAFAQRWADQCIYDPYIFRDDTLLKSANDVCRDLPDFDIAQVSTRIHGFNFTGASVESTLHLLINMISSDLFNVTTHVVLSGYAPEEDYGAVALHSKAYLIGCGVASYLLDLNTDGHRMSVIYCNIGPLNGMFLLDRYYKHGEPCSDCPSGTSCHPNSYFQFLCQRDNSLDNPKEVMYSRKTHSSANDLWPSGYFLLELEVTLIYILMRYV
ncbi:hypothetical protein GE061_013675 [Apolygus lucorum]|uniref:Uncharacterized protein n=1 Tax=Apolygus lucorum TaxID=248454 RepID=A0A6A4KAE4_APOLU|nr:hypothetical protein GE061_013675 [Apolygus lucorum]